MTSLASKFYWTGDKNSPESKDSFLNWYQQNSSLAKKDFFNFVNKEWINKNPIPDDYKRWSAFTILAEDNKDKVKKLILNSYNETDDFNKVQILYLLGIDRQTRNNILPKQVGKKFINQIQLCQTTKELFEKSIELFLLNGFSGPFNFSVYADMENSDFNIMHFFSSGLGMPDRDYYLNEDKQKEREEYKKFMKELIDYCQVDINSDNIYNIEKELAKVMRTRVEKRDPHKRNNPTDINKLNQQYPNLPWSQIFTDIGKEPGKINISNPEYFERLNELVVDNSNPISGLYGSSVDNLSMWKDYFTWRLLLNIANYSTIKAEEILFNFYGKVLSGTPKMKPLKKRVLNMLDENVGEIIGKKYAEKYFSTESKKLAEEMVEFIRNELEKRIVQLDWMSADTKIKALEKLNKFGVKIGYPDKWRDFSNLGIDLKKSLFDNILEVNRFEIEDDIDQLYQPVDKSRWFMNVHTVNAYYSPLMNEIVFPAGILQEPFFSPDYPMAYNFGGMGSVIGHEMTHGFDDQGRKFDSDGNLNDWWTDKDARLYQAKTDPIKTQFGKYLVGDRPVNGDLTQGENIADLGGVSISFKSYLRYFKENGDVKAKDFSAWGTFTPEQLFFINYARIWRGSTRDEEMQKRLVTDPHSPPIFRVNGSIINLDDFARVFGLKKGDGLWKENRLSVW
jgi:putative endopeptidase